MEREERRGEERRGDGTDSWLYGIVYVTISTVYLSL
jgi:hypothetical protein